MSHVDEIECCVEGCINKVCKTQTEHQQVGLVSHPPVFYKQKIMWSCLARQRSGLLATFLLLLGLTIFKEFEVRGQREQNLPAVTEDKVGSVTENEVKRIFEEKPGGFPTVDEVVRTNLSDVETVGAENHEDQTSSPY